MTKRLARPTPCDHGQTHMRRARRPSLPEGFAASPCLNVRGRGQLLKHEKRSGVLCAKPLDQSPSGGAGCHGLRSTSKGFASTDAGRLHRVCQPQKLGIRVADGIRSYGGRGGVGGAHLGLSAHTCHTLSLALPGMTDSVNFHRSSSFGVEGYGGNFHLSGRAPYPTAACECRSSEGKPHRRSATALIAIFHGTKARDVLDLAK